MIARFWLQTLTVAALGFGVGALAGCQHDIATVALGTPPASYGLYFTDNGETAKLAYGVANSDDVGLMMECEKGSHQIALTDLMSQGSAPRFTLTSLGRHSDFAAEIQSVEGSKIIAADVRTNSPAIAGFRDSGRLHVASGGKQYDVVATSAEKAEVRRFFAVCDRA